jgi:aspartyl-tRNA(Asn)/glutamyl-tRNA(Gln) amidotransferase subunit C
MGEIKKEDVVRLAKLSRLSLDDNEVTRYQKEIESILHYFDKLQDVDTEGLKPTFQVTALSNVTRPDEISDYKTNRAELMKNAPDTEQDMFKVGRMVG